jgi:hypothetical protein
MVCLKLVLQLEDAITEVIAQEIGGSVILHAMAR